MMQGLASQPQRVQAAIMIAQGNITRAAVALGISKQHMMEIVRRLQLNEWARQVRVRLGHPTTGNPLRKRQPRKKADPSSKTVDP